MAYSGFVASDVQELAARFGNRKVNNQTNMLAPFVGKKLKRKRIPGKVGIVNIRGGGLSSTKWLADGGALPAKANKQPVQGTYLPKVLFSRLGLPRLAAALVINVADGVALVMENLDAAAEDIARQRGRGFLGPQLASVTTNANQTDTSIVVSSSGGFRIGMSVDVYTSGDVYQETITVSKVDIAKDGTATLTISAIAEAAGITTTHKLYLQGSQANGPTGLRDITAAASLYSQSQNSNDWHGNLQTMAELNIDDMRLAMVVHKKRRGKKPKVVLMSSMNEKRYSDLNINNRRYAPGQVMDATGGLKAEFDGIEIFVDDNLDDDEIFYGDLDDVMIHEFVPLGTDGDGEKMPRHTNANALVDDTDFVFDMQFWEAANLRVMRRNGWTRLSGIAA